MTFLAIRKSGEIVAIVEIENPEISKEKNARVMRKNIRVINRKSIVELKLFLDLFLILNRGYWSLVKYKNIHQK